MTTKHRAAEQATLFDAGYDAFKAGKSLNHNPEPRPAYPNHRWWVSGWEVAEREAQPTPTEAPSYTIEELRMKLHEHATEEPYLGSPYAFLEWLENNP